MMKRKNGGDSQHFQSNNSKNKIRKIVEDEKDELMESFAGDANGL